MDHPQFPFLLSLLTAPSNIILLAIDNLSIWCLLFWVDSIQLHTITCLEGKNTYEQNGLPTKTINQEHDMTAMEVEFAPHITCIDDSFLINN